MTNIKIFFSQWTETQFDEKKGSITQRQLKERLYIDCIDYFDKGKVESINSFLFYSRPSFGTGRSIIKAVWLENRTVSQIFTRKCVLSRENMN